MMVSIREISFSDCLLGSMLFLPPLGTYFVRHCMENEGVVLGAYFEEMAVGIVVIEYMPKPKLTYIFVEELSRRKGIGTILILEALSLLKRKGVTEVEARLVLENEYSGFTGLILGKAGFEIKNTATIIRYANDERCHGLWAAFMKEKGNRICDILIGRGYRTLTFDEASTEIINRLKASIGREFISDLDPFSYVLNQHDRFVSEYSFITLKNNDPAAFVTVTTVDDKTLVFQQISIALKYQGNGTFLLPFAAFMEKFLTGDVYTKVAAVVLGKNEKMQRLIHSFIGSFSESMKTQNEYQCKLMK